jgi:hypothetical protein
MGSASGVPNDIRRHGPGDTFSITHLRGDRNRGSGPSVHGKRVLCSAQPIPGHAIPTAALALEFQRAGNEVTMITYSGRPALLYGNLGLPCIDLTLSSGASAVAMMLSVLRDVDPDITICDWRHDLWLAQRAVAPRCRISILRCENFLGYRRRARYLPDKFGLEKPLAVDCPENRILRGLLMEPLRDRRTLYGTEVIVVPSLPVLDPPPPFPQTDYPYSEIVYTGPLLVDCFGPPASGFEEWVAEKRAEGLPIVLLTTGTAWGQQFLLSVVAQIDRARFACIFAFVSAGEKRISERYVNRRVFVADQVRLRDLVASADVVLHHAGHGTLQTVLSLGKPSITIPSYEYDREDNAIRLEELGCSVHLSDALYRDGLDMELLNRTVERVIRDKKMSNAAAAMACSITEFTRESGPARVLRIVAEKGLVPPRIGPARPTQTVARSYGKSRWPALRLRLQGLKMKTGLTRWSP